MSLSQISDSDFTKWQHPAMWYVALGWHAIEFAQTSAIKKIAPPQTAERYHVTTDGGKIGLKFFKPAKRAGKFWAVCNMIIPNFSKTFSYHLSIPNILGAPPQHSTEGGWLVNQVKGQSHKAQLTKRQRKRCKPKKILIHAGGAPKI